MEEVLGKLKCNEGLVKPYSPILELIVEVNNVDCSLVSFSHDAISIGNMELPILGTSMRLLMEMGHKGGGFCVNGQGMTKPLEAIHRPWFVGLG